MRSSRLRQAGVLGVLLLAGAVAAGFALAWRPAIAPVAPPDRAAFAPSDIARGAELAAVGDCAVCHTAQNGRPYAGGRGVPTPFGTVYAVNITPDAETGIGRWSEAAFQRAMRDGIGRDGRHLYPVLPYPHFTRATDADIAALYAFFITRAPMQRAATPNALPFPLDQRAVLAGWNLLYLRPGAWRPDTAHDERWNRGAYLVGAVGHCGACHTPHNALGAERSADALGGGEAEGWYAPALTQASPSRLPWTEAALATYLRTGYQPQHGAAAGPMTAVTDQLAGVPDADINAMAAYLASLMPQGTATPGTIASADDPIFAGACGGCHGADAPMTRGGAPPLSLSTSVNAPTSQGVIQVLLHGIPWRDGKPAPYMPAFGDTLTDAQLAALAAYLRAHFTDKPAWPDITADIARARHGERT